jgi:hypothetical protein
MAKQKIDFDTVRSIALGFPGVEESTMYGTPALKIRGNLMTCIAVNKSAEPDSLGVSIDFDRRAELMEGAPDVYYLTDHYASYPIVLVRLSRIDRDTLRDLLGMALRFVSSKKSAPTRSARKVKTPSGRSPGRR